MCLSESSHSYPTFHQHASSVVSWDNRLGVGALGGAPEVGRKRSFGTFESSGPCSHCLLSKSKRVLLRKGLTEEGLYGTALRRLEESHNRCEDLTSQLNEQMKTTALYATEKTRAESEAKRQLDLRREADKKRFHAEKREEKAVVTAENHRKAADAHRNAANRARIQADKQVSVSADGTRRPLHRVQVASSAQGGRRMALNVVQTATRGSLQVRAGFIGGLEYRLEELVYGMTADVYAGIASRKTMGLREEANQILRTQADGAAVHVVPSARPGTQMRRSAPKGPVQVFARPCNATMAIARHMFRMLLYDKARQLLPRADSIVIVTDGKSFKSRHAIGVIICIYYMEQGEEKDPFGNCPEVRRVIRIPLQLQMQANKMVSDLLDRNGKAHGQQTPFHVIRAFELAGLESVLRDYRHILCITTDAAADNRGVGKLKRGMDSMCGKFSLIESILVSGRAWAPVEEDLKRLGIRDVLLQFNEGDEAELRKLTGIPRGGGTPIQNSLFTRDGTV